MPHLYHMHWPEPKSPRASHADVRDGKYADEYIKGWQPLMPLDGHKITPAQRRVILDKLYRMHFIVYDRLAEI